jgi:uncharacterized membrane protein
MQCPSCHNEVASQAAFCGYCGAQLGAAPAGGGVAAAPIAGSPGISENAAAAISYLTIIPAVIFLILEPYNRMPLVRFHSFQSIALCVSGIILQVGIEIVQMSLHFLPGIWFLFSLIHLFVAVVLFIAWLVAILKASKGEYYKLPVIGDFAERQARG